MLVFYGIRHFMVVFMGSDPSWMISSVDFNDRIWLFFPPHYGCTHPGPAFGRGHGEDEREGKRGGAMGRI